LTLSNHVKNMPKFTIIHDVQGCIGCGACEAVCPDNWTMKEIDGEVKAVAKKTEIDDHEFTQNKEAADSCPVNVIHLHDKENGNKA